MLSIVITYIFIMGYIMPNSMQNTPFHVQNVSIFNQKSYSIPYFFYFVGYYSNKADIRNPLSLLAHKCTSYFVASAFKFRIFIKRCSSLRIAFSLPITQKCPSSNTASITSANARISSA